MSMTIDEKVVEMRFDNKQFEQGVQTSLDSINDLKQGLKFDNATKGLDELSDRVRIFSMDKLSDSVMMITEKFGGLKDRALQALESIEARAIYAGKNLITSLSTDQISAGWDKYADKTSSVQTIMAATAKDWEDTDAQMDFVNSQMDKLNWYTDETSAGFMDMVNNIGKFTSAGVKLDTAVTAMQGIANWGYISGAGLAEQSRAMYNLSQALATGTVKLMDWRSIENANMATMEFKENVLDSAVAMGTLRKVGDGMYQTMKGTAVSATNFNEALSEGWFTSEVLMDSLAKYGDFTDALYEASQLTGLTASDLFEYIDQYKEGVLDMGEVSKETGVEIELLDGMFKDLSSDAFDLGRRALAAGQEAKTFSEAIEAVKDAVSTGWMNTFEIIFGDYQEAKKLWTAVSNELYDVFAESGNARNEMLKAWKEMGGRDTLINAFANAWHNLRNTLGAVKDAFRDVFPAMTAERLAKITSGLSNFVDMITLSDESIDRIRRTFRGLFSILGIVKDAFDAVFWGVKNLFGMLSGSGNGLLEIIASFGDWLTNLRELIQESGIFTKIMMRLMDVLDPIAGFIRNFGKNAVSSFRASSGILTGLTNVVFNSFRKLSSSLIKSFSVLTGFDLAWVVREVDKTLNKIRVSVVHWIKPIQDFFKSEVFDFFKNFFNDAIVSFYEGGGGIAGILEVIFDKINDIVGIFAKLISLVTGIDFSGFDSEATSTILKIRNVIVDIAYTIQEFVKTHIGDFIQAIKNGIIAIKDFFTEMKTGTDIANTMRNVMESIRHIISIIWQFLSALIEQIKPLVGPMLQALKKGIQVIFVLIASGVKVIEKFTRKVAEILRYIDESLKKNQTFQRVLTNIFDRLKSAATGMLNVLKSVFKGFGDIDTGNAGKFAEKTSTALNPVVSLFEGIKSVFSALWEFIKKLSPIFKALATAIGNLLKGIGTALGNSVSNLDSKDFLNIIKGIFYAFTTSKLWKLIKGLRDTTSSFKDMFEGIVGVLNGVQGCLEAWQKNLKAKSLLSIAIAVGILAASLLVLSDMDAEKLTVSMGIVSLLFLELNKSFKSIMESIGRNSTGQITATAILIIGLSVAMLLLAGAMKKISALDEDQLLQGMIGIAIMMLMMAGAAKLMASESKRIMKGAIGLIAMAIAVRLLVKPVVQLGAMPFEQMKRGLIGLGALLVEVAAFAKISSDAKKMISIGVGLLLVALVIKMLVKTVTQLGEMDPGYLGQGLIALGLIMAEISAFIKLVSGSTKVITSAIGMFAFVLIIKMLVNQVAKLGSMDTEGLKKGLLGLSAILLALGAFIMMVDGSSGLIKAAVGIMLMGSVIVALSAIVLQFAKMSLEDVLKGVLAFGAILIEIALFYKYMQNMKDIKKIAAVVGAFAAAMVTLAGGLSVLAKMTWQELAVSLIALAGGMAMMVAAMKLIKGSDWKSAMAMVLIAVAIDLLVGAIKSLNGIGIAAVALALLTLAGVLGVMIAAVKLLKPVIPVIEKFAFTCMMFAVSVLMAGVGILALGSGLTALAAGGTAALAALGAAIMTVIGFIPLFFTKVGEGLIALLAVVVAASPDVAAAVVAIINNILLILDETVPGIIHTVLSLLDTLLEELSNYLPNILQSLMKIIKAVTKAINDNIEDIVDDVVGIVIGIVKGISKRAGELVDEGIMLIVNLIDGLAIGLEKHRDEIVDAIWELIVALLDIVLAFFGIHSPSTVFEDIGKNLIQGLINGIKALFKALKDVMLEIINGVKDIILTLIDEVFGLGADIITNLADGIVGSIKLISEAIHAIIDALVEVIMDFIDPDKEGSIFDIGKKIIEALGKGISNTIGAISTAIGEVIGAIRDFIDDFVNPAKPNNVFSLATTLIDGLAAGIVSVASHIVEGAKAVLAELKSGLLTFLDPNSEYSIWAFGDAIISSLVAAIEQGIPKLVQYGERIAYAIGKGLGGGLKVLDMAFTGWMDEITGNERKDGDTYSAWGFVKSLVGIDDLDDVQTKTEDIIEVSGEAIDRAFKLVNRLATNTSEEINHSAGILNKYQLDNSELLKNLDNRLLKIEKNTARSGDVYFDTTKVGKTLAPSTESSIGDNLLNKSRIESQYRGRSW